MRRRDEDVFSCAKKNISCGRVRSQSGQSLVSLLFFLVGFLWEKEHLQQESALVEWAIPGKWLFFVVGFFLREKEHLLLENAGVNS